MGRGITDLSGYGPGLLVSILNREINDAVQAALDAGGFGDIRRAHGIVFEVLDAAGSRVTDMAQRARMTKQSMGELVSYLEGRGYLRRKTDPSDRRAKLVVLTRRGAQAVAVARVGLGELESAWERSLGERRARMLRSALSQLCAEFAREHIR